MAYEEPETTWRPGYTEAGVNPMVTFISPKLSTCCDAGADVVNSDHKPAAATQYAQQAVYQKKS